MMIRNILYGSIKDITEEKRIQMQIFRQAQIIEQIHSGIVNTDIDGVITHWNRGAERLFNIPSSSMIGKHISSMYPDKLLYKLQNKIIPQLKKTGKVETEMLMQTKDGEAFFANVIASEFLDDTNKKIGYTVFLIDITERKTKQRAFEKAQKILKGKHEDLQKKNIALAEVLSHIEKEKHDVCNRMKQYIESILLPIITKIKNENHLLNNNYVDILEKSLNDLPFYSEDVLPKLSKLSPREIEISTLIKHGYTSKDISAELNISLETVHKHRQKIRKKLSINNDKTNLITLLRGQ